MEIGILKGIEVLLPVVYFLKYTRSALLDSGRPECFARHRAPWAVISQFQIETFHHRVVSAQQQTSGPHDVQAYGRSSFANTDRKALTSQSTDA